MIKGNQNTQFHPGTPVYSIAGPDGAPDALVGAQGLPAFTHSAQASGRIYPAEITVYSTDPDTRVMLHDKQELDPTDAVGYRFAGAQMVELPDGELRVLDPRALMPHVSTLARSMKLARTLGKSDGDANSVHQFHRGHTSLLQHHLRTKHNMESAHGTPGAEVAEYHRRCHDAEDCDHTHGRGWLST
jgi:hypothetical protein